MVRWTPPLTSNQQIALALIPKFTASLSILGSIFIVQHVLRSPKRRKICYHHILLGLSSMDVISSFKSFMSTWILPKETGAWGAVGTVGTCTAAGFWGQGASIASPLYNGSLALFYLLTVKYGWKDDPSGAYNGIRGGRFSKIEPYMHAIPLLFGWSTAIAGLPLQLYNPIGWTCWIAEIPRGCDRNPDVECERGNHSYIYRWAFFHAELWFTFVAIVIMMIMMYQSVRETERKSQRYSVNNTNSCNESRQSQARRVSGQALLYVLAFFVTWIFPAVQWLLGIWGKTYTPILMLQAFFVPLQGFWNAFIYLRPRYLRNRRTMPNRSRFRVILSTLSSDRNKNRKQEAPSSPANEGANGEQEQQRQLRDSDFHSLYEPARKKSFLARIISARRWSKGSVGSKRGSAGDIIGDHPVERDGVEGENMPDEEEKNQSVDSADTADKEEKGQATDAIAVTGQNSDNDIDEEIFE